MTSTKAICHRDHTVTYWAVYQQLWVRRTASVPARELAAMPTAERERVQRHLAA